MLSPGGKRVVRTAVLQGRKYPLPDPQVSKLIDIAVDVREMTWNWGLMAGTPCDAPMGETSLAMASWCGEEAAATYLLQRGANIEGWDFGRNRFALCSRSRLDFICEDADGRRSECGLPDDRRRNAGHACRPRRPCASSSRIGEEEC